MSTLSRGRVEILDDSICISDLLVQDERAVSHVRRAGEDGGVDTLLTMIRVGAEGLEAMSDVQHLDFVREQVSGLLAKAERAVDQLGDRLVQQADAKFDPAQPGSYSRQVADEVNRARTELTKALQDAVLKIKDEETRLRRDLDHSLNPSVQGSASQLAVQAIRDLLTKVDTSFDPKNKNGHAASFIAQLDKYASAGGPFEERLRTEFKDAREEIAEELRALRDLVVREQTVRSTKPSSIGDEFESAVEALLSQVARHADGDRVENVSREIGEATNAKAGDFDYHLGIGHVIAIEARNRQDTLTIGGKTGVLEQLKKTKANRKADFAIYCVANEQALPEQVGYLQRYDDRIVCCFGDHGEILALAIKFARMCVLHDRDGRAGANSELVRTALEEIQRKITTLATVKRWCSNITESADKIRAHVGSVTIEVSETIERAVAAIVVEDHEGSHSASITLSP